MPEVNYWYNWQILEMEETSEEKQNTAVLKKTNMPSIATTGR